MCIFSFLLVCLLMKLADKWPEQASVFFQWGLIAALLFLRVGTKTGKETWNKEKHFNSRCIVFLPLPPYVCKELRSCKPFDWWVCSPPNYNRIFYALAASSFFLCFLLSLFFFQKSSDLLFMNLCNKGKAASSGGHNSQAKSQPYLHCTQCKPVSGFVLKSCV